MNNTETSARGGIGLGPFVFLTLLILKSTGTIGMCWFLVITSFIWAPILLFFSILALMFLIFLIFGSY